MTTLVAPCHIPTALARVPEGIASQSIRPKTAAARPTDNAGRNHPKRDLRPFAVSREQVNNVEEDRGREQAQWERDQYLKYRVPQYLGFALHALLLPSLRPLIAAPLFDSVRYTLPLTINQVNILFI